MSEHARGDQDRKVVVIVNPTKVADLDEARRTLDSATQRHGYGPSEWVETTESQTGEQQARDAVAAGADLVCSFGGDGTVRAVAAGLVGTDVPLGLLPGGTGNLLARNLGLPVDQLAEAAEVALGGAERRIDVGLVRFADTPGTSEDPQDDEQVFVVMTGIGFDGDVMADAPEGVKKVLGWPAYILSGIKHIADRGMAVSVKTGPDDPSTESIGDRHGRMVVVGNCGTLQGGVELLPDAVIDDGILDTIVLAPRTVAGWASVLTSVATRNHRGHGRVSTMRSRSVVVSVDRAREAQIDGDPVGEQTQLALRVLPEALIVRVP